jgi:PhoPQ-activated pathogenicity-related protein
MRFFRLLGAALAAAVLTAAPAQAKGPNALDAYVAKADPSFNWRVQGLCQGEGYRCAVLELTSQTWAAPKDVDAKVWKHWMTIIIPDRVSHTQAFLYITGGDKGDPAPTKPAERFAKAGHRTPAPSSSSWTTCPTSR